MTSAPVYAIVTFGAPKKRLPLYVRTLERAVALASAAVRTGTCEYARVIECDTIRRAKTADISTAPRAGERVVYSTK